MTTTHKYAIGCYADGNSLGDDYANHAVIDLIKAIPATDAYPPAIAIMNAWKQATDFALHSERTLTDEQVAKVTEETAEIIEDAVELLNELTEDMRPAFTHWEFNEGDFGLYPDLSAGDGDETVLWVDAGYLPEFVRHVNDHGNVTLYRVTLVEEWSLVYLPDNPFSNGTITS